MADPITTAEIQSMTAGDGERAVSYTPEMTAKVQAYNSQTAAQTLEADNPGITSKVYATAREDPLYSQMNGLISSGGGTDKYNQLNAVVDILESKYPTEGIKARVLQNATSNSGVTSADIARQADIDRGGLGTAYTSQKAASGDATAAAMVSSGAWQPGTEKAAVAAAEIGISPVVSSNPAINSNPVVNTSKVYDIGDMSPKSGMVWSGTGWTNVGNVPGAAQEMVRAGFDPLASSLGESYYNVMNNSINEKASRYYGNELTKSIQNYGELSSAWHNWAKSTGLPTGPNPYEYAGDLAVAILKGTNEKSRSSVYGESPTDYSTLNLPGGLGIQDTAWNAALAYDKASGWKTDYSGYDTAIAKLQSVISNKEMGAYGNIPAPTSTQQGGGTTKLSLAQQQAIGIAASGSSYTPENLQNPYVSTGTLLGFGAAGNTQTAQEAANNLYASPKASGFGSSYMNVPSALAKSASTSPLEQLGASGMYMIPGTLAKVTTPTSVELTKSYSYDLPMLGTVASGETALGIHNFLYSNNPVVSALVIGSGLSDLADFERTDSIMNIIGQPTKETVTLNGPTKTTPSYVYNIPVIGSISGEGAENIHNFLENPVASALLTSTPMGFLKNYENVGYVTTPSAKSAGADYTGRFVNEYTGMTEPLGTSKEFLVYPVTQDIKIGKSNYQSAWDRATNIEQYYAPKIPQAWSESAESLSQNTDALKYIPVMGLALSNAAKVPAVASGIYTGVRTNPREAAENLVMGAALYGIFGAAAGVSKYAIGSTAEGTAARKVTSTLGSVFNVGTKYVLPGLYAADVGIRSEGSYTKLGGILGTETIPMMVGGGIVSGNVGSLYNSAKNSAGNAYESVSNKIFSSRQKVAGITRLEPGAGWNNMYSETGGTAAARPQTPAINRIGTTRMMELPSVSSAIKVEEPISFLGSDTSILSSRRNLGRFLREPNEFAIALDATTGKIVGAAPGKIGFTSPEAFSNVLGQAKAAGSENIYLLHGHQKLGSTAGVVLEHPSDIDVSGAPLWKTYAKENFGLNIKASGVLSEEGISLYDVPNVEVGKSYSSFVNRNMNLPQELLGTSGKEYYGYEKTARGKALAELPGTQSQFISFPTPEYRFPVFDVKIGGEYSGSGMPGSRVLFSGMKGGEHLKIGEAQLTEAEMTLYKNKKIYGVPFEQSAITTPTGKVLDYGSSGAITHTEPYSSNFLNSFMAGDKWFGRSFDKTLSASIHIHSHPNYLDAFASGEMGNKAFHVPISAKNIMDIYTGRRPSAADISGSLRINVPTAVIVNRVGATVMDFPLEIHRFGLEENVNKLYKQHEAVSQKINDLSYNGITTIKEYKQLPLSEKIGQTVYREKQSMAGFAHFAADVGMDVRFVDDINIGTGIGKVSGFAPDVLKIASERKPIGGLYSPITGQKVYYGGDIVVRGSKTPEQLRMPPGAQILRGGKEDVINTRRFPKATAQETAEKFYAAMLRKWGGVGETAMGKPMSVEKYISAPMTTPKSPLYYASIPSRNYWYEQNVKDFRADAAEHFGADRNIHSGQPTTPEARMQVWDYNPLAKLEEITLERPPTPPKPTAGGVGNTKSAVKYFEQKQNEKYIDQRVVDLGLEKFKPKYNLPLADPYFGDLPAKERWAANRAVEKEREWLSERNGLVGLEKTPIGKAGKAKSTTNALFGGSGGGPSSSPTGRGEQQSFGATLGMPSMESIAAPPRLNVFPSRRNSNLARLFEEEYLASEPIRRSPPNKKAAALKTGLALTSILSTEIARESISTKKVATATSGKAKYYETSVLSIPEARTLDTLFERDVNSLDDVARRTETEIRPISGTGLKSATIPVSTTISKTAQITTPDQITRPAQITIPGRIVYPGTSLPPETRPTTKPNPPETKIPAIPMLGSWVPGGGTGSSMTGRGKRYREVWGYNNFGFGKNTNPGAAMPTKRVSSASKQAPKPKIGMSLPKMGEGLMGPQKSVVQISNPSKVLKSVVPKSLAAPASHKIKSSTTTTKKKKGKK